jgi:hypothetical protein
VTQRREGLDLDATLYIVRDNLGKADAYITAVEELIEQPEGSDGDEDDDGGDEPGRRRNHVAHLIESAKLAVRAAICASIELDKHWKRCGVDLPPDAEAVLCDPHRLEAAARRGAAGGPGESGAQAAGRHEPLGRPSRAASEDRGARVIEVEVEHKQRGLVRLGAR